MSPFRVIELLGVTAILCTGCRESQRARSIVVGLPQAAGEGNSNVVVATRDDAGSYRHASTAPSHLKDPTLELGGHIDAMVIVTFHGRIVERMASVFKSIAVATLQITDPRIAELGSVVAPEAGKVTREVSVTNGVFSMLVPVLAAKAKNKSGEWVVFQTFTTSVSVEAPGHEPTLVSVRYGQPETVVILDRKTSSER